MPSSSLPFHEPRISPASNFSSSQATFKRSLASREFSGRGVRNDVFEFGMEREGAVRRKRPGSRGPDQRADACRRAWPTFDSR